MRPNIMFVDDSISVRADLHWLFKDEPYFSFGFDNPFEALGVIKSLEWAVVVADQKMQKMDGLEFMERVRTYSPNTKGIIMTTDDETKENLEVLYSGNAYRFVKKPLDSNEIKQAVKEAIAQYENTFRRGRL
ncbi:MAG: response regulator [Desulfobacterales bacterium]